MSKNTATLFLAVFLSVVFSFIVVHFIPVSSSGVAEKEAVLEKILRTNTLRCGYYNFPPMFTFYDEAGKKNPKGFSFDMMDSISKKTGLKVEWTEEVTFGNWPQALQAGRIDAVCTPIWPDAPLGRVARFTDPLFYSTLSPLVRIDDNRFQNDLNRLNESDVTFVVQDGGNLLELTKQMFPKAKYLNIAANVEGPIVIQNIIAKKADAILLDRNGLVEYNKHNGEKLRMVAPDSPVKYQPFVLAVNRNASDLQEFLNNAQADLYFNHVIEHLIRRWEAQPGLFVLKAE